MEKKNSSSIIGMIGVLILIIILYNSMFSSRAKMDKNLKDLADTKEFVSTDVDKDVLDYVCEQKGYAMMKKSDAKDYQKLGTVRMVGKNNNTINTFDVYVRDGHDYAINMRGIYMKVLNMKVKCFLHSSQSICPRNLFAVRPPSTYSYVRCRSAASFHFVP